MSELIRQQDLEYRQQDLNYQHAVCDAHPELEHLRPTVRVIGGKDILDNVAVIEAGEEEAAFDPYPLSPTTMKEAARMCAHRHKITVQQLIGRGSSKFYTRARSEFVTICRIRLGKTHPEIARYMSNRDHTTICHYFAEGQRVAA